MTIKWLEIIRKCWEGCLVWPTACLLCEELTKCIIPVCEDCSLKLPWIAAACRYCAMPVSGNIRVCPSCQASPPPFEGLQALFDYREPIVGWMMRFKYQATLNTTQIWAHYLCERLTLVEEPDYVIPVPIHPKRQKKRGFNQTLEIAKLVAKKKSIPLDWSSCKKIRHTKSQSESNAAQRRRNIQSRDFVISSALKNKKILIIEDVVTTGSTMRSFCLALKKAGVKKIDIWCCCRTISPRKTEKS